MALAAALLVSTSAWAAVVWDPDADQYLTFNMNFQIYNNTTHKTTDAEGGLVGTLADFNTASPNVFGETSRAGLGVDANFAELHDVAPGDAIPGPNDCKLVVPSDGTFDLDEVEDKHTWTFWFNVPSLTDGTIIRHADAHLTPPEDVLWWEIRILSGKLHFRHQNNGLKMETASSLADLGVAINEWHSAAVVIDRTNCIETSEPTKEQSAKLYVDGLEVPILVTSVTTANMKVDIHWLDYASPLWIGAGEREFDGLLDNVRLFARDLNAIEVSIINQPDTTQPRALLPIPRSENVVISTNLTWDPADGASTQYVYFGTDSENLTQIAGPLGGAIDSVDPCAGDLALNTQYYWYVKSNGVDGPHWSFTTETGKAINPSPADGEEDVPNHDANLIWATPTAATYDVYVSTVFDEANDSNCNDTALRGHNRTDPNLVGFDPCDIGDRGQIYYWRVDSNYVSVGLIKGDVWSFRTEPYELVFNTSNYQVSYSDHLVGALACEIHGDGWTTVPGVTSSLDGNYMNDGNAIAVFNFPGPNYFNYDRRYDIIVVPQYRGLDIDFNTFPTPLAIHTTGDFYFDGRVQIAGDDVIVQGDTISARSGGWPGPKWNQNTSVFSSGSADWHDYWSNPWMPVGAHGRFGVVETAKEIFIPTTLCKKTFGPGVPVCPPYKGGGGGGAGGAGGEAGRGYFFGINSSGPSYGDEEVPIPFGGSAGGWGSTYSGAAGGGGIEIVATGNVVLDSNSQIRAWGGDQAGARADYTSGGGGGGSVKIVANGSVTVKGSINVNGGNGGNATGTSNGNDTGGGGGGGRVAIFYGSGTAPSTSKITYAGGAHGYDANTPPIGLAKNGESGTLYVASGAPNSAKKASAPTPKDGDKMAYCNPDPCNNFQLKWYSGYGGTTDAVYCGTNPTPGGDPCGTVPATRGQHSVTITVSSGKTYYWKVVTLKAGDPNVSSDTWSFTTVKWQCPFAISNNLPHVGGPEWDFNHDCVIDLEDLSYFVEDWLNGEFGEYMLGFDDFAGYNDNNPPNSYPYGGFGIEWRQCINRTDGCAGF
jgi:hypothetical protein